MNKSITPKQEKQYKRFVEDAAEKALVEAGPDKDGLQTLFSQGDGFQAGIVSLVKKYLVSQKFAYEEAPSNYGYPSDYRHKELTEQTNILRRHFPGVGFTDPDLHEQIVRGKVALPEGAEGWYAVPRWQEFAPTYEEALALALKKLGETRKFCNYRTGQLGPDRLRQSERTAHAMDIIGGDQKGDILIVAGQFGLRHRGKSVRRAREVFKKRNEFGLDSFAIACMLLTHPERLVQWVQLHVDCAGDEYKPVANEQFSYAPIFFWDGGEAGFDIDCFVDVAADFGSVSGFLPQ